MYKTRQNTRDILVNIKKNEESFNKININMDSRDKIEHDLKEIMEPKLEASARKTL
jgi:hypothetical protein